MGKGNKNQPNPRAVSRHKEIPDPKRLPELPGSNNSGDRLCWRFTHMDDDGPWGFGRLDAAAICELLAQMRQFESMTVNEVFHRGDEPGKCYELEALPTAEARDRLELLDLADQTKIWRLRLGGKGRLYGFLTGNVFHVVWWDPLHQIWPSVKKNT